MRCEYCAKAFCQVHILYQQKWVTRPAQQCNLDETDFTAGRDLIGVKRKRVITISHLCAGSARTPFRHLNRKSVLVTAFADGQLVLLVFEKCIWAAAVSDTHLSKIFSYRGERIEFTKVKSLILFKIISSLRFLGKILTL